MAPNWLGYVSNGYKRAGQKTRPRYRHRSVYEAWNGLLAKGLQIDHRNGVRNDNRLTNLEPLTAAEHARKTARTTLAARVDVPVAIASTKAVWRVLLDTADVETERTSFQSAKEAAAKIPNRTRASIQQACNKGRLYNGFFWEYVADAPDQADETWTTISSGQFRGLKVSNIGRVQMAYGKTYGSLTKDGYRVIIYNNVSVRVHVAVCTAFHGPALDTNMTVDHRDQQRSNNRTDNLRWATSQTQGENSSNSHAVKCYIAGTEILLDTYPSCKAAQRATGIDGGSISKCCRGKQKTSGQHSDGRRLTWNFATQN